MAVAKDKGKAQGNVVVRTFQQTYAELRKVVWPTRPETIRLTIIVIAISSAIGAFLFASDSIFLWLYTTTSGLL